MKDSKAKKKSRPIPYVCRPTSYGNQILNLSPFEGTFLTFISSLSIREEDEGGSHIRISFRGHLILLPGDRPVGKFVKTDQIAKKTPLMSK